MATKPLNYIATEVETVSASVIEVQTQVATVSGNLETVSTSGVYFLHGAG
jgi:hypothetical protein